VGRKHELLEIIQHTERSEDNVKVVCLYGPGGMGKTTLSRRLAANMTSSYPDGQFCIKLNGATPNPMGVRSYFLFLFILLFIYF